MSRLGRYIKLFVNAFGILFSKKYLIIVYCNIEKFEYLLDYLISQNNDASPFIGKYDKNNKVINHISLRKSYFSTHASEIGNQKINYFQKANRTCIFVSFNNRKLAIIVFFMLIPIVIAFNIKTFNLSSFFIYMIVFYIISLLFLFHHFIYVVNSRIKYFFNKQKIGVEIIHWLPTNSNSNINTYETKN